MVQTREARRSDDAIRAHYEVPGLDARILAALQAANVDVDRLERRNLWNFDELHIGGVAETRTLARRAGLKSGDNVLDIGCGLGGPARTLAAEFDCTVIGLDLVEAFCHAAEMLTLRVGLSSRVSFRHGHALNLPFNDETFDVVWLQHTTMNIPDKRVFFKEAGRVLKPGGKLAIHTILAGAAQPIHYPVVWAGEAGIDFIVPAVELREVLIAEGFEEMTWQDVTQESIAWFRQAAAQTAQGSSTPLSLSLYVDDLKEKGRNTLRNLEEGRITAVQAVYERSDR